MTLVVMSLLKENGKKAKQEEDWPAYKLVISIPPTPLYPQFSTINVIIALI